MCGRNPLTFSYIELSSMEKKATEAKLAALPPSSEPGVRSYQYLKKVSRHRAPAEVPGYLEVSCAKSSCVRKLFIAVREIFLVSFGFPNPAAGVAAIPVGPHHAQSQRS